MQFSQSHLIDRVPASPSVVMANKHGTEIRVVCPKCYNSTGREATRKKGVRAVVRANKKNIRNHTPVTAGVILGEAFPLV